MKQSLQFHENQLNQIGRNIKFLSQNGLSEGLREAIIAYSDLKTAIDVAIEKGLYEFDPEEMINGNR